MGTHKPEYHGNNLTEAIARAKAIRGLVIKSTPPGTADMHTVAPNNWGFWSDKNCMVRNWESVVWPEDDSCDSKA